MLTPQEVSERAFPKASFGGYNMTQVDEFLDVLTEDYSALYSENAVLKSKMKVLVEKVEEYRSTEEAMRKALMTAQRMADDLVKEAEQKRDQILQEAAAEAQKKVDSIRQEAEVEQFRLAAAQKETAGYVAKVKALHAQAQAGGEDGGGRLRHRRQRPALGSPGHGGGRCGEREGPPGWGEPACRRSVRYRRVSGTEGSTGGKRGHGKDHPDRLWRASVRSGL